MPPGRLTSLAVRRIGCGTPPILRAVTLAAALVVASACSDSGDSDRPTTSTAAESSATAPEGGYRLDLEATIAGETADVEGTTNLPTGTVVTVGAARSFRGEGEADSQTSSLGSTDVNVMNGGFSVELPLDDESLLVPLGPDSAGVVIDIVSPVVLVCAQVLTGKGVDGLPRQPVAEVSAALGDNGEQLARSPGASVFGENTDSPSTRLNVEVAVDSPPPLSAIEAAQGVPAAVGSVTTSCGL